MQVTDIYSKIKKKLNTYTTFGPLTCHVPLSTCRMEKKVVVAGVLGVGCHFVHGQKKKTRTRSFTLSVREDFKSFILEHPGIFVTVLVYNMYYNIFIFITTPQAIILLLVN